jgi:beta-glucanase (GH16 family)
LRPGLSRIWRVLVAVLCVVSVMTGFACTGSASPSDAAVRWVQAWRASFAGPIGRGIDTRNWEYVTGSGEFGDETMTSSPRNVYLDGHGDLDITAVRSGSSWTSGLVQTKSSAFAPPLGGELMVTASIRQPGPASGLGYWPAFWMLGPGRQPEHGEIDILEDVNGLSEHSATLHCGSTAHRNRDGTFGPCHEFTGLSTGLRPCPGCQDGYHVYSVVIDRRNPSDQQIRWYLDGREFLSASERQVGTGAWAEAVDHGFRIILDLAIGGSYPDMTCGCTAPDSATTPGGTMSVRYLAVYDGLTEASA